MRSDTDICWQHTYEHDLWAANIEKACRDKEIALKALHLKAYVLFCHAWGFRLLTID